MSIASLLVCGFCVQEETFSEEMDVFLPSVRLICDAKALLQCCM